jgi:hypothetical protein
MFGYGFFTAGSCRQVAASVLGNRPFVLFALSQMPIVQPGLD